MAERANEEKPGGSGNFPKEKPQAVDKDLDSKHDESSTDEEDYGNEPYYKHKMVAWKIVGTCKNGGKLSYWVEFKDKKRVQLLPAKLLHVRCPQVVIAFYERNMEFGNVEI